ncbi:MULTISPECIES: hypothetical protein [unclassified Coleofasciculus]|uniref:hypothetical protein n=1 Tax=unclassified Coleofasciculus TaxID=2692782 RepID=UPI00187E6972|nr:MULTISPECIES: hypothetical protein [unclassified Coleofasciculus]MBE9128023.1 hypothetical protein [Coleofasciculus sp. LEGE 07081]MBE9150537.1 hypothetical protein [Coleofasciculus sp. LEGE 07092]
MKALRKTIDNGTQKVRCTPVESEFQLLSLLKINLQGKDVGGCILKKGEANYTIQFAFDCRGIHTTLREEAIDPVFEAIEAGFKDLPDGESLTIQLSSFTNDSDRQHSLDKLIAQTDLPELKFLLMGEKARIQEITRAGIRKPKRLILWCTYTLEPGGEGTKDVIEKAIAKLERWWKTFTGEIEQLQFMQIERLLYSAFTDGYQNWEQLISNKMGLDVRPLKVEEIWEVLWKRFNQTLPRELPSYAVLDENGLSEEIKSDIHPLSLLMESESSIPVADRRWINVNGKYIGMLTFIDKPGGWADKNAQMRYLWEVMARDRIFDTEIICQVNKANPNLVKDRMQSLTKQANISAKLAADKNSIDVKSQLNIQKTVEAQAELYEGAVPLYVGTTFLIYRDSVEELDDACRYLSSLFMRPAWVDRETEYPWRIWLQTFPLRWEKLLAKPYERRKIYLSGEIPGLLPLCFTRPCDKSGFELIAAEGGTPIFLNMFTQHKNLALFGTTRSGKSVIASGILTQALAYGMPISSMDYPKADGSSTFSDYTKFMGDKGAYFDIGKESSNLFELPNLRGLDPKLQAERFDDYKDFLLEALMAMILGAKQTGIERTYADTVRSILTLAMEAFFSDVQIRDRYAKANTSGLDTPEWELSPTLADFVDYCSIERLRLSAASPDILKALEQVKLRLRFWLNSRVGKSISKPSTFRADAQLLVFALRNLSNDEDAAILSLAVYSAALRRSLAAPASIFFIDESPILFEYETVAALVGRLCANGAKSGIRVILSAQDPDTISKSPSAAKIFQNMTTRLVGRIQPTAIDSFVNILKYPREVISRNATEAFFPKKEGIYSQWLLDDGGTYTYCRFYPGYPLLAAVANNPDESQQRSEALARHPENRLLGLAEFSRQLVESIRAS